MASEECWIQPEDIERLKDRKQLTLLIDGWEDKLKQSSYGAIAAEVHQFPVVLSLTNLMLLAKSVSALDNNNWGTNNNKWNTYVAYTKPHDHWFQQEWNKKMHCIYNML